MSQSITFTKRHKSFFLRLCENIDGFARFLGDMVSPEAWADIRNHFSTPAAVIRDAEKNTKSDIDRMLNRCFKYKEWCKTHDPHTVHDYAKYIVYEFIKLHPANPKVVPVNRKEETKTTMEIKFLGTVSIKEALDAFSKLDFEHPSTINLPELFSKGYIFFNGSHISVFNDEKMFADNGDCLLSKEEWDKAFEFEKKFVVILDQINLLNGKKRQLELLSKRKDLEYQFAYAVSEDERIKVRYEIQQIDRELDSLCRVW